MYWGSFGDGVVVGGTIIGIAWCLDILLSGCLDRWMCSAAGIDGNSSRGDLLRRISQLRRLEGETEYPMNLKETTEDTEETDSP